jgi:hypothetical protein
VEKGSCCAGASARAPLLAGAVAGSKGSLQMSCAPGEARTPAHAGAARGVAAGVAVEIDLRRSRVSGGRRRRWRRCSPCSSAMEELELLAASTVTAEEEPPRCLSHRDGHTFRHQQQRCHQERPRQQQREGRRGHCPKATSCGTCKQDASDGNTTSRLIFFLSSPGSGV